MKIISRQEALRRGLKWYCTGQACKRGHVAKRHVRAKTCLECAQARSRERYAADPEKARAYGAKTARAWRAAHPEESRARGRAKYAANREKIRARGRAKYAANPEKYRAYGRAYILANREKRRARYAADDRLVALNGLGRARYAFPGCVPPDFDLDATIPFYAKRRRLTRETGIPHEVDHIHALCLGGKHIASNLQVITATANRKKARAEQAEAKRQKRQTHQARLVTA